MAVSKRLRHEIFRRDNFTCQNCGAKAPDVKLEPDHVIPVALGGSDEPSNLQTLCEDCNAGKSATPPDARTVAKVADDAKRWAMAMETAAGNLLGARQARDEARVEFDAKWASWSEGRPPLPRPQGWEISVDSLIKAGLPLEALLDCVDIAMSKRHVRAGDVFKYMCGVAWKEIRRLQKEAGALVQAPEAVPDAPDEVVDLWEEAIVDLYDTLTPDEQRFHEISSERLLSLEVDEDERYPVATAFDAVLTDLRSDLWSLALVVDRLLRALPHGIGDEAMKRARIAMYDRLSDHKLITRHRFAEWATREAVELLEQHEESAYFDGLTPEDRAAWLVYAEAVQQVRRTGGAWSDFSDETKYRCAARHAYMSTRSRIPVGMCTVPIGVTECLHPATHRVLIEGEPCCEGDPPEGHGHPVCMGHLEVLAAGEYRNSTGKSVEIRDFAEIEAPGDEEPPF